MHKYVDQFNDVTSILGDPTELMGLNCSEIDEAAGTGLGEEMKLGLCKAYSNKEGFTNFIGNITDFLDEPVYEVLNKFNESELSRLTHSSKLDEAFNTVEEQINIVFKQYSNIFIYNYIE